MGHFTITKNENVTDEIVIIISSYQYNDVRTFADAIMAKISEYYAATPCYSKLFIMWLEREITNYLQHAPNGIGYTNKHIFTIPLENDPSSCVFSWSQCSYGGAIFC